MATISLLQRASSPWLDHIALWTTRLGSEQAYVALLLLVYLCLDARAGRLLGVAVLVSLYLNQQVKALVDTARPFAENPELLRSEAARLTAGGAAFPSGHVQIATTFWGFGAALARRRDVTALAVVVVTLVALTRVYLGVHWPLDVLGGALLGAVVVAGATALARLRPRGAKALRVAGWVVAPLVVHWVWPTAESGLIAGALAGFATGREAWAYRPPREPWRRAAVGALGFVLVFAWMLGTGLLLPEAAKEHALVAPARYFLLVWAGLVAAPWLADRAGLLPSTS